MTDDTDLFPDAPEFRRAAHVEGTPMPQPPTRLRTVPETDCWTIEDHCCRHCLGRIASRAATGRRLFMCTDCQHVEEGTMRTGAREHPTACSCSIRFGSRDAGIRCVVNDNPTPDLMQRIVAKQVR